MSLHTEDIVGYPVCGEKGTRVVNYVTKWLRSEAGQFHYFACLNPHSVEIASADIAFHNSLLSADFLVPDGVGIIFASRILGGDIQDRVTGMDVFLGLSAAMNEMEESSCFFLGSTEKNLAQIKVKMAAQFPHVRIAGTYSPPYKPEFSEEDNENMIQAINASGADVLWVGLTAPKQEKWIHDHRDELNVRFAGPIGAVFDFYVGNIKRVGPFWQKIGLEWLPRLVQEPRRLWRRSFVSAPAFLFRTFHYRMEKKRRDNNTVD